MLTVFHPTDCSPEGHPAYAHALRIAYLGDSRLQVLHVDVPDDGTDISQVPPPRALLERWGLLEEGSSAEAERVIGIEVATTQVAGLNIVRVLLRYLEKHPADLIVLGTKGREGIDAWWHGSVAEPIARVSKTMSLFVPHVADGFVSPETGAISLDRILVPVCNERDPQIALAAADALRQTLGVNSAHITACYVGDAAQCPTVEADDIELVRREGDIEDELVAAAAEFDADLVVMATAGRRGVLDAFRGSTTERVLRRITCPLLSVPAPRQ